MLNLLFNRYLALVTGYPKAVLFMVFMAVAFLAAGLPNFKLDASSESLTLENDRDLDYYRKVSKDYQSGDFLIVTFKPQEDLFSDASLQLLTTLRDDLASIPGVVSVNSILDVPLLYSPKQSIAEILRGPRTLMTQGVDRALAKQEFLTSPIYKDMILGPDGQTTALQLNIRVDNTYIELVRERDALRQKIAGGQATAQEEAKLREIEATFLDYRTLAEKQGHERVELVRDAVAKFKPQAEIFVGGITMITADMISFIQKDLVVFGAAVVLFMILLLAFIFRSAQFVVIPMMCCLISVVMMLGYVSWLDWRLTVISSNFVALLLIISLAIIIHLVVRYREYHVANPDWSQKELVSATVRFMIKPCVYTTITTIVAFASLVVSGIRPVIDFGWMMSIGLVVALSLSFLILPAGLMLLPKKPVPKNLSAGGDVTSQQGKPLTLYFSWLVEHKGGWVLVVSLLVAVLSGVGISRLDVENRFIDYFHESTEIYQGLSVIDNNLGGTTSLEIILTEPTLDAPVQVNVVDSEPLTEEEDPFGEDDPFAEDAEVFAAEDPFDEGDPFAEEDPFGEGDDFGESHTEGDTSTNYWMTLAGLSKVEEVHAYLESLPEVGKVQSLATLLRVGRDVNNGLNDIELSLLERSLSGDVRDVLITPFISPSGEQARIVLRIHDLYPGLKRAELAERIETHIQGEILPANFESHFTGLLVLYNNMLQSLFKSQILTLGVVFLCIFLVFTALFRSVVVSVIALVPNILAALSILGLMGLIGLPLDMMTITVAGITLGICVDDTIHYIHRFKVEIKKDGDYIAAMQRSHSSIGRAVFYTSVIIIFGFSIMALSQFIPTIYFGMLTGLAMFAALMAALLLLPKLILIVKPFKV